jgi:hypothetical protein
MPERLAADKKQKFSSAHADLVAALSARAISLTDDEASQRDTASLKARTSRSPTTSLATIWCCG